MVGFNFGLVLEELLCAKFSVIVRYYGNALRLKWNLDLADPTENRNLENLSKNSENLKR